MRSNLVFLPGTLCNEASFETQHRHLADIADCLTLPLTEGNTIADMATSVLRQAPEQFALVGFSQGAVVALDIMRQAPKRVTKLCLMACNPRGSTAGQLDTWRSWQETTKTEGLERLAALFASNVHPDKQNSSITERIVAMALQTGVSTFLVQLEALASRIDSRPHLRNIHCPTLLMVGEADKLTPLRFHEETQQLIPQARLLVIPESGHYLPLEQPVAVSVLLRYWLGDTSSG